MPFGKNYNSNNNQPSVTTYSSISFSNPESTICQSKLNISYFNRLLKIGIALKNQKNSNDTYDTYDNDNQAVGYVSSTKAKMIYDTLQNMKTDSNIHSVSIEIKNGLLTISDGSDFGVSTPVITIRSTDGTNVTQVSYETKANYHKVAINYSEEDNTYEDLYFNNIELEVFETVLLEYFKASTYAIAATVAESNMYRHNYISNRLNAIAEKLGVADVGGGDGGNRTSFLNNSTSTGGSSFNGIPKGYEQSTLEDIVNGIR